MSRSGNFLAILFISSFLPTAAMAEDAIDLKKWQELDAIAKKNQAPGFLPPKINATSTTTQANVYQQVLNYNVEQVKAAVPQAKILDTKFEGNFSSGTAAANNDAKESVTTIQFKPLDSKASINFRDSVTSSFSYNVWNHQGEAQIYPSAKWHGTNLVLSHTLSPLDQQSRLLVRYSW